MSDARDDLRRIELALVHIDGRLDEATRAWAGAATENGKLAVAIDRATDTMDREREAHAEEVTGLRDALAKAARPASQPPERVALAKGIGATFARLEPRVQLAAIAGATFTAAVPVGVLMWRYGGALIGVLLAD